jgi:mRNA-degrading endonuclease RelE of RelBE toxin-antitoxin system
MMFDIKFTDRALDDLATFPASEQRWILTELEMQLMMNAADESQDRKRIRPDMLAEWAVRLGQVRVFYDVDVTTRTVKVEAVGKRMVV